MEFNIQEFVGGQVHRNVKRLFLSFIYILEDLKDSGKISDEEFARLRKRVFDHGNDCSRNITDELENFDLLIKKN
jgi:hypothetical protein